VHDHGLRAIELLETLRDTSSGLHDLYQSFVANRMNETMKVLTIMASFFIPVTFIAGVYGMNFEHMPELSWPLAYPTFWIVCAAVTVGLAVYFKRKGWIDGGD
jgi:magnesium transporter